ncbi:MAG: NUDIX domain-containing protein [Proteobacteria bacterium]|nr:NUDIX domain-containing protein [Pseudomonadota bacterium]
MKGVVTIDGRVCLLFNERDEWELPGGKLEPGEDPQDCLAREIDEELGLKAMPERILDSWLYRIVPGVEVVIVTYACAPLTGVTPRISHEHKKLELFAPEEIDALNMPDGYKASIRAFFHPAR